MGIRILKGGLMTTVQDGGRRGYQRFGMGVSGAVDVHSYVYANILVGNHKDEAVLEATMLGPSIKFISSSVIAITGGDLSPSLDGKPAPMYQALAVKKGSILSFGMMKSGCRAYIAFAGGLMIQPIMGSRSTYIRAALGGFEGRKLMDGDEIAFRQRGVIPKNLSLRRMEPEIFTSPYTVRVLMGPQDDRFTEKGLQTFLSGDYKVTEQFDRMGCRLTGPKIEHVTDGNIITDGIAFGAIQVPDGGEPIIMLSDRQTTGGYAKIGSVINVDMPYIAQAKTGDVIRFVKTDIETAQDAFVAQLEKYDQLRESFDHPTASALEGSSPERPQETEAGTKADSKVGTNSESEAGTKSGTGADSSALPADKAALREENASPKTGKYLVKVGSRAYKITLKEIE